VKQLREICKAFPPMRPKQFREFKEDLRVNGLRNPIVTYQGKILDGKERYRACLELGIKPRFVEFKGDGRAALDYAVSANMVRQTITNDQRVVIAAELEQFYEEGWK